MLELLYCKQSFSVTRSFYWYQNICPCDLGLRWSQPLSGALCFTNTSCLRNISLPYNSQTQVNDLINVILYIFILKTSFLSGTVSRVSDAAHRSSVQSKTTPSFVLFYFTAEIYYFIRCLHQRYRNYEIIKISRNALNKVTFKLDYKSTSLM